MYPFQKTKGLSIATENVALHHRSVSNGLEVFLCPSIPISSTQIKFQIDGETIISKSFSTSPDNPYHVIIEWEKISTVSNVLMILLDGEEEILRIQI